ncbi:MAG: succinate dehydrogenase [Rhodocyclaceae bacterium]|nr:succinate dehydrogenase [Rhodocyclaceae bacterium]
MLGFFVLVHLATMIYAVRSGLSAGEILSRTRGNTPWMLFYALFVVSVAVHVPIGLRNILAETFSWRGRGLEAAMLAVGVFFLLFGLRAVWAVYAPGAGLS